MSTTIDVSITDPTPPQKECGEATAPPISATLRDLMAKAKGVHKTSTRPNAEPPHAVTVEFREPAAAEAFFAILHQEFFALPNRPAPEPVA